MQQDLDHATISNRGGPPTAIKFQHVWRMVKQQSSAASGQRVQPSNITILASADTAQLRGVETLQCHAISTHLRHWQIPCSGWGWRVSQEG